MQIVDNGRSLREDVKDLTNHSSAGNYVDIPVYLKRHEGERASIGRRHCTTNCKIRTVRSRSRDAGSEEGAASSRRCQCRPVVGISSD